MEKKSLSEKEFCARVSALERWYPWQFERARGQLLHVYPGWLPLIEDACRNVAELLQDDTDRSKFRWLTIKQNIGELRMYFIGVPYWPDMQTPDGVFVRTMPSAECLFSDGQLALIDSTVSAARLASRKTCQLCGGPGEIVAVEKWQVTRCPEHVDSYWAGICL